MQTSVGEANSNFVYSLENELWIFGTYDIYLNLHMYAYKFRIWKSAHYVKKSSQFSKLFTNLFTELHEFFAVSMWPISVGQNVGRG